MNGEDLAVANAVVVYTGIGPQLSMTEKAEKLMAVYRTGKAPGTQQRRPTLPALRLRTQSRMFIFFTRCAMIPQTACSLEIGSPRI
jgi:hypothetical protein